MRPIQFYADAVRQLSTAESSAAPKSEEKLQRIIKAQHCLVHPTAVAPVTVVAAAQARRPGSSDGDGEADVERATKRCTASERWPWHSCEAAMSAAKLQCSPQAAATLLCSFSEFDLYNRFV